MHSRRKSLPVASARHRSREDTANVPLSSRVVPISIFVLGVSFLFRLFWNVCVSVDFAILTASGRDNVSGGLKGNGLCCMYKMCVYAEPSVISVCVCVCVENALIDEWVPHSRHMGLALSRKTHHTSRSPNRGEIIEGVFFHTICDDVLLL